MEMKNKAGALLARASSVLAPAARGCQQDGRGAEALQGRCQVEKGEGR